MADYVKYRCYCETEAAFVFTGFVPSTDDVPTLCPTDGAHTVTVDSWVIVGQIADALPIDTLSGYVKMDQAVNTYGGNLFPIGERHACPALTQTHSWVFKAKRYNGTDIAYEPWAGQATIRNAQAGDKFRIEVVDVDNVLAGGAGAVLIEHGSWLFLEAGANIIELRNPSRSKLIPAGVYYKIFFEAVNATNALEVIFNLLLEGYHKP